MVEAPLIHRFIAPALPRPRLQWYKRSPPIFACKGRYTCRSTCHEQTLVTWAGPRSEAQVCKGREPRRFQDVGPPASPLDCFPIPCLAVPAVLLKRLPGCTPTLLFLFLSIISISIRPVAIKSHTTHILSPSPPPATSQTHAPGQHRTGTGAGTGQHQHRIPGLTIYPIPSHPIRLHNQSVRFNCTIAIPIPAHLATKTNVRRILANPHPPSYIIVYVPHLLCLKVSLLR